MRYRVVDRDHLPSAQQPLEPDEGEVRVESALPGPEYGLLAAWLDGRDDVWLNLKQHGAPDLTPLRWFPGLRRLIVTNLRLTSWRGIEHVADSLEHLSMGDTTLRPRSVEHLACLGRLRTLGLAGPVLQGEVVGRLTTLERLSLRSVRLDHARVLPSLTGLARLDLHLGSASLDMTWLTRLPSLVDLEIWRVRGIVDIDPLARLPQLRRLSLQSMGAVTTLPSFARATSLVRLALDSMKGVQDLSGIAEAPALEELLLVDMPQLDPEALRPLVGHPTLRRGVLGLGSLRKNAAAQSLLPLEAP